MLKQVLNLSVRKRLLVLNVIVITLISLVILIGWYGFHYISHKIEIATLLEKESMALHVAARGLSEFVITQGTPLAEKLTRRGMDGFENANAALMTEYEEDLPQDAREEIASKWEIIKKGTESLLGVNRDAIGDDELVQYGRLSTEMDLISKEVESFADSFRKGAESATKKIIASLGFGVLLIMSVLSLFLILTYRSIAIPISEIKEMAENAAAGDLSLRLELGRDDELGVVANAINTMIANLKGMISKIGIISKTVSQVTSNIASTSKNILHIADVQQKAIEETTLAIADMGNSITRVSTSAESLSKTASDTSASINQLSTSIEKVADNTKEFSDTTQNTTASIEEMVANIKEISESVEKLFTTSSEIVSSIEEVNDTTKNIAQSAHESVALAETVLSNASSKGLAAADAATQGMEIIKNNVVSVSEVINTLGRRSHEIGKILTVIDTVADQTNLLALNAAILAAHAGEHGKGFAIVANEIKDLAERTSKSTMEIASLIKSVQEEAQSSITMATEGVQTVQNGMRLVRDVHNALSEILNSSKVSTEMARAIQKSTAEESAIIKHITNSIEAMNQQIEIISRAIKEQNKGSSLIIEATEKVNDISTHLKTAIGEQRDGSRHISTATEDVAEEASLIASSTGQQKEKSLEIVQSMEKIRSTTGSLVSSSNEMYETINALQHEALNLLAELQKFKV